MIVEEGVDILYVLVGIGRAVVCAHKEGFSSPLGSLVAKISTDNGTSWLILVVGAGKNEQGMLGVWYPHEGMHFLIDLAIVFVAFLPGDSLYSSWMPGKTDFVGGNWDHVSWHWGP